MRASELQKPGIIEVWVGDYYVHEFTENLLQHMNDVLVHLRAGVYRCAGIQKKFNELGEDALAFEIYHVWQGNYPGTDRGEQVRLKRIARELRKPKNLGYTYNRRNNIQHQALTGHQRAFANACDYKVVFKDGRESIVSTIAEMAELLGCHQATASKLSWSTEGDSRLDRWGLKVVEHLPRDRS